MAWTAWLVSRRVHRCGFERGGGASAGVVVGLLTAQRPRGGGGGDRRGGSRRQSCRSHLRARARAVLPPPGVLPPWRRAWRAEASRDMVVSSRRADRGTSRGAVGPAPYRRREGTVRARGCRSCDGTRPRCRVRSSVSSVCALNHCQQPGRQRETCPRRDLSCATAPPSWRRGERQLRTQWQRPLGQVERRASRAASDCAHVDDAARGGRELHLWRRHGLAVARAQRRGRTAVRLSIGWSSGRRSGRLAARISYCSRLSRTEAQASLLARVLARRRGPHAQWRGSRMIHRHTHERELTRSHYRTTDHSLLVSYLRL